MLDRSPSPENQTLTNQVAQFLNIHEDRIKIDELDRALIHCATDDEMYDMQEQWASMTMHFCDRIRYLVLHKDDYQRELPLNLKIFTSQSLVKPT